MSPGSTLSADLVAAFAVGATVDAGGRRVRAAELAALVLAPPADDPRDGVPALRLTGAVVTGCLDLSYGDVAWPLHLVGCTFEEAPRLTGASTRTLDLSGSALPGLEARLLDVRGDLRLSRAVVTGRTSLENAHVAGTLSLYGARLANPGGRALSAGGLVVGGGLLGRGGLVVEGEARLIGARVDGGVLLEGARVSHPEGTALCLDEVVTNRLMLGDGFTCEGELKVREARVSGQVNLWGCRLRAPERALRARGLVAGELFLLPEAVEGMIDLSRVQVGALRDSPQTWPERLRLDGFTYDQLISLTEPVSVAGRCRWLERDPDEYRPQPYEQLAAHYRRLGHDDDARRVLLAKERRRRGTLPLPSRLTSHAPASCGRYP